MLDASIPPSDDWMGWQPIPSTVTVEDLDGLEKEMGLKFPPQYRDFLQYQHFVALTERGVCFDRHLVGEWSKALRKSYFSGWPRERIIDHGLIPFGSESFMDAGPVSSTRVRPRREMTGPSCFGITNGSVAAKK